MTVSPGQRLGPYEVLAPLGAGGMGEVWAARDTRLDREVAVKVLPRGLAQDPERRARFEREARAVSALSHPHVCALFDVGRADGPDGGIEYLVMERLEGETLAVRLTRGPLPVHEALVLGSQLAGALAAAHRRGIVHRDLKPGNVMLTRSGAKLLDFGLARRDGAGVDAVVAAEESSATLATEPFPLTRAGTLVGTWPYLAPEQVQGRLADARSDVFALGCVLYEALAGRRAFPGSTRAEIVTAVVDRDPPDLRQAAPGVPASLATLVRQCLAKDPDVRWQCADDVVRGLQLVEDDLARPPAQTSPARAPRHWTLAAGLLGLATAVTTAALLLGRRTPSPLPLRFSVVPPPGVLVDRPTMATPFAVAPDGRRIAFMATDESLWLWSAEDGRASPLEGASGGIAPFFSPDGRELAFFAGDHLKRVPIDGGPATAIATGVLGSSGTWAGDGTILFMRPVGRDAGLQTIPARGGEARSLAPASSIGELRAFPRFLPDGRHYLFLAGFGKPLEQRRVCVASIEGGEPDCFASCHSQAEYSASGHVLCIRSGALVALPFDPRRRKPSGEAVTVARDVRWLGPSGSASFAVSADGRTLVYEPRPAPSRLAWFDRTGRETGVLGEPGALGLVQLAPDGRRVAVDLWHPDGRGRDVWSLDALSGLATRLTFDSIDAWAPAWSPDGTRLAYASADAGPPDLAVLHLDGSGRTEVLLHAPGIQIPRHWSPDGRWIAYEDGLVSRHDQRQLWLLSVSDGTTRRVTVTPFSSYHGRFSPDGRRLAYVSEESGRPEVYVVDPHGGPPRRVSHAGGLLPRWRADAGEIFFFQPDGWMVAVEVADRAAVPKALFQLEGVTTAYFDYDVTADGQRFLVRLTPEPEGAAGLRVALEWSQQLGAQAEPR